MVWIRWPGTSEPQEYRVLVDTGSQCTLIPSEHVGEERVSIVGVTGGSQELSLLEAEVSLTGEGWQKHPIVTGPEAPCILGIDFLRSGYYKDPKGFRWAFGIAAVAVEGIKQFNNLLGLSENPSATHGAALVSTSLSSALLWCLARLMVSRVSPAAPGCGWSTAWH